MRFIKGVLLVLVLLVIAGVLFVGSGVYGIGADEPHWSTTQRVIDLLRDRSITVHAKGIAVPDLNDPKRIAEGAEHYAAMCTGCHLAPGMADTELRQGLYPMPPDLAHADALDPGEAFWIIKHGVKLTAMPAWGKSHDDESIWGLVAFVRKLPQMTPEQYQQAAGTAGGGHEHHHHGDSDQHDHGNNEQTDHGDHDHTDAHDGHEAAVSTPLEQRQADVRARGPDVMSFSLDATQHVFEKTATGGTQRVVARDGHAEQVSQIREHLQGIARAFTARDFSGPTHIHGADMPGLADLKAAPADALTVTYRDVEDGAELTYRANTDALRDAVHRWFDAQLADHGHDATDHAGHTHGA